MSFAIGCMCVGTAHDSDCFINKPGRTVTTGPTPMQRGWKCPECGRGYSPWFRGPCNHTDQITGITTEDDDGD